MPSLAEVAAFLDGYLRADDFPEERGGVHRSTVRPVARLGLALDPWDGLGAWAADAGLDALFLHRHRRLDAGTLPAGVGVLAYHAPFDHRLTTGWNPRLAAALGMSGPEPLGERDGRALGMLGTVGRQPLAAFLSRVEDELGGVEEVREGAAGEVERVAVARAMTDALVREAAARGARVYLTGELRVPARAAVGETGITAVAVGHRRGEEWGLRALAGALRERWPSLETVVAPGPILEAPRREP